MWELFALSAALTWAIVTVLDKVLLERHIPSGNTYLIMHGLIGMLPLAGMLILGHGFALGNVPMLGLAWLAGVLESIFMLLYYKALQKTDASIVAIFLQGVPVAAAIIGLIFFHENLMPVAYFGIALVVLGTVLAILVASPGHRRVEWQAMGIVLPAMLAISIAYSLQSYTLDLIDVDSFFIAARVGQLTVACIMLLFVSIRRESLDIVTRLRPMILPITIVIGLLNVYGTYLLNQAYALGPFALVTTLSSIQPILILFMISIANTLRPHTVPDQNSRHYFWRRAAATVLVGIGIWVSLS